MACAVCGTERGSSFTTCAPVPLTTESPKIVKCLINVLVRNLLAQDDRYTAVYLLRIGCYRFMGSAGLKQSLKLTNWFNMKCKVESERRLNLSLVPVGILK